MSDKTSIEQAISDELLHFGEVLDLLPTGLIVHQLHGITYSNRNAAALAGQKDGSLVGHNFLDFLTDENRELVSPWFFHLFNSDKASRLPDLEIVDQEGTVKLVNVAAKRIYGDGDDAVVQLVIVDASKTGEKMAGQTDPNRDPSTGLFNRRQFIDRISNEVRRAIRFDNELSILLLKICNYGDIVSDHGIKSGHKVLRQVAALLNGGLRETDSFDAIAADIEHMGRTQADQFGIVMPHTGDEGVSLVANRLHHRLTHHQFTIDGHSIDLDTAIGFAVLDPEDLHYQDLLGRAESALHRSEKQDGAVISGE